MNDLYLWKSHLSGKINPSFRVKLNAIKSKNNQEKIKFNNRDNLINPSSKRINNIKTKIKDRMALILRAQAEDKNITMDIEIKLNERNQIDHILNIIHEYRDFNEVKNNDNFQFGMAPWISLPILKGNIEKISRILEELGIIIMDETAIIIKEKCFFKINLKNANIKI